MLETMTPEQVCEILNEHKWRGRDDWHFMEWFLMDKKSGYPSPHFETNNGHQLPVADARAVASWLAFTKPGSWHWAYAQMKAGNSVKHPRTYELCGMSSTGELVYLGGQSVRFEVDDFARTDWTLAD